MQSGIRTPQSVVDAIHVVARYLREIEAAEAVIAPAGGASFHPMRKSDELLSAWDAERKAFLKIALAAWRLSDEISEFGHVVTDTDTLDTLLVEMFGGDWQEVGAQLRAGAAA